MIRGTVIPMPSKAERLAALQARTLYEGFNYFNKRGAAYVVARLSPSLYTVTVLGGQNTLLEVEGRTLTEALATAVERHRNLNP